jgi:hypothetical protein
MPSLGAGEPQNGVGTLVRRLWYETEHLAPTQELHIPKAGGTRSPDAREVVRRVGVNGSPPSALYVHAQVPTPTSTLTTARTMASSSAIQVVQRVSNWKRASQTCRQQGSCYIIL